MYRTLGAIEEPTITAHEVIEKLPQPVKTALREEGRRGDLGGGIVTDGLVLYLPMNEGQGTVAYDNSGLGNDGVINGALWEPKGLKFDGVEANLTVPNDSCALTPADAITVELWVYTNPEAANMDGGVHHVTDTGFGQGVPQSWNIYWDDRGGEWQINAMTWRLQGTNNIGEASISDDTFNTDKWWHIVGTYDKVSLKFYLDTQMTEGDSLTEAMTPSPRVLSIGSNSGNGAHSEIMVGEYRLHNRALSLSMIKQNYSVTKWRYE